MAIKIFKKIDDYRRWRHLARGRVGFVPTMGALHAGHATLLQEMRHHSDHSVLSIFVNPSQFGPQEDLSRYPRTFESDFAIAEREGVEAVFAPTPEEMYPHGYSTFVEETQLSKTLCGPHRPGHFRGVATIVLKLFHIIQPGTAWFGLKDAQQFHLIQKMIVDLDLPLELKGVPTVREEDGLAMSSRNVFLSPEDRRRAALMYRALQEVRAGLIEGTPIRTELERAHAFLSTQGFDVQYLELLALPDLSAIESVKLPHSGSSLLAVAALLGGTRLIDNVTIEFPDN